MCNLEVFKLLKLFLFYHGVSSTKIDIIFEEYNHREYMECLFSIVEMEEILEELDDFQ